MPEFIQNIDVALFYWINQGLSNSILDKVMPFITHVESWLLIYLLGFYLLFFRMGRTGKLVGITLILTIIITDQVNSSILKELFGRIRPCHTLDDVNLLVGCGGGKSFPSSHAANNFAAAMVITYFLKKNYIFFFSIAGLVALSRVYVGVHYPVDVIAGAFVGLVSGYLVSYLVQFFAKKYFLKSA